jgi:hypothetical protein
MPFGNSQNERQHNLNNGNYLLDLPTGIRLYVGSRLHNKDRKVRSYTPFFRLNGTLPTNGLTGKEIKSIPIGKTAQLNK